MTNSSHGLRLTNVSSIPCHSALLRRLRSILVSCVIVCHLPNPYSGNSCSTKRLGKTVLSTLLSCFFGDAVALEIKKSSHHSYPRSAKGWSLTVSGSCWVIGSNALCDASTNVCGHVTPKWVRSTGPDPGIRLPSASANAQFSKLIPLQSWIHSSLHTKLLSDGPSGVIVCPTSLAKLYPSPVDHV